MRKQLANALITMAVAVFAFAAVSPAQQFWRPPVPERIVLSNGLTLMLVENHSLPVVAVKAMIKSGASSDPEELPGLANFTSALVSKGTKTRTAEQIARAFDLAGVSYENNCDYDSTSFSFTALSRDMEKLLPVLFDLLQNPAFDSLEVERLRVQLMTEVLADQDSPRDISRHAFDELLYHKHPYGHPLIGNETSLNKIARSDIKKYHKNIYLPQNCVIILTGDIKTRKAISLVKKLAKNWPATKSPVLAYGPCPDIKEPSAVLVHRPISQAYITMGFLGPKRNDPDYQAARVMNYILGGGGFVSRIFTEIRVHQGLAYDVDSYFYSRLDCGPYVFTVQTKCVSADTAVKSILAEIRRMQSEPVADQELEEAKAFFRGSYPFRYETDAQIASQIAAGEIHGLGAGYAIKDLEQIQKVTKEDVQRAAQKFLHPDNFVLAMATDTSLTKLSLPGMAIEKK
jgi:zinc protease